MRTLEERTKILDFTPSGFLIEVESDCPYTKPSTIGNWFNTRKQAEKYLQRFLKNSKLPKIKLI